VSISAIGKGLSLLLLVVALAAGVSGCEDRVRCQFSASGEACADGTPCNPSIDGCHCGCMPGDRCAVVSEGAGQNLAPICVKPCGSDAECLAGEKCDGTAVPCASCSAQFYICR
jgi:hypothetical protein